MTKFIKELDINRYQLAKELVRQPQLYMEWALKAASVEKEVRDLKHDLEVLKANVEKRIRNNPEKFGLEGNPKEGSIKAEIARHRRVKRKTKELSEAIYNERILKDAQTAFVQRRKMLENLTSLNVQLHFADVKLPQRAVEASGREVKRKIQRSLSKRKIRRRE